MSMWVLGVNWLIEACSAFFQMDSQTNIIDPFKSLVGLCSTQYRIAFAPAQKPS